MRLIFIRHGDPDYANDNLTPKGKREVELLTKRVSAWKDITQIYVSSMGRARATAAPSLQKLNIEATVCDWLREFDYKTVYPKNVNDKTLIGKKTMCWDIMPEYFCRTKSFLTRKNGPKPHLCKAAPLTKSTAWSVTA